MLAFNTGTVLDACWWHGVDLDIQVRDDYRRYQVLALARYGRFGGSDVHQWDDEPLEELEAWYAALARLMEKEHAMQTSGENG